MYFLQVVLIYISVTRMKVTQCFFVVSDEFDEATQARHDAVIKRYALEKTRKENLWRARMQRVINLRTRAVAALPPVLKAKVSSKIRALLFCFFLDKYCRCCYT